jgi:hypothetical protein
MKKLFALVLLTLLITSCSVSKGWEVTSNPNPEVRFYDQPHGVYTMTWYEDSVLHIRYYKY